MVSTSFKELGERLGELLQKSGGEKNQKTPTVRKKVFLSFIHTDKQMVDFLRGQTKNEGSELDFIDMSIKALSIAIMRII